MSPKTIGQYAVGTTMMIIAWITNIALISLRFFDPQEASSLWTAVH